MSRGHFRLKQSTVIPLSLHEVQETNVQKGTWVHEERS